MIDCQHCRIMKATIQASVNQLKVLNRHGSGEVAIDHLTALEYRLYQLELEHAKANQVQSEETENARKEPDN